MSRPFLALDEERRAVQRLRWYMLLRWAGVAVLYTAGVAARTIGQLDYSLTAGNVLAPFVLAYNVVVWRLVVRWERTPPQNWQRAYRVLGNVQCSLDLMVLAVAVHFAGGIESWAVIEPIAVLVVAGLVLSARDSLLQGLLACALVNAVVISEATGLIDHVGIGILPERVVHSGRYVAAFVALYDSVVIFIVFLVVFIAQRLREREEELTRMYGLEHESVRRLEEIDRLKSDFLATVSHELRTPLTAIIGFSKHLRRNWDRTTESLRLEQVSAIERQSNRLQRLVEDLLDFSAIEAHNLSVRPEQVDVREVVDAAMASCRISDVQVDVAPGATAWADPHRFEQILVNLLDNAAKYGTRPIGVSAAEHDGVVTVAVTDAGAGLPTAAEDQVFARFVQLDRGPTRTSTGVGLGLALVKGYVEAQGGRVWYERAEPAGARFCFSLPRSAPGS
ncbi:MAG TPA: HAMP domain-containing sensor histidine kinase [Acidimicrobiales bacterium]|nr:HAMP domain-containing sensor histidine kinase [Acidimicrobiales bacterium]